MNISSPKPTDLTVMLITHNQKNVEGIKKALKTLSNSPDLHCRLWRCKDAALAPAMSVQKRYEVDIVLLCMDEEREKSPMQSFNAVLGAFPDTPVIVLSHERDKSLALGAIAAGAASNVTFEDLHRDAGRLTIAVEYTLARYKSATTNRTYMRDALKYLRKQNKTKLRSAKAAFAKDLQDEKDRGTQALEQQKIASEAELENVQQHNSAALRQEKRYSRGVINAEKKRTANAIDHDQQHNADVLEEREMIIRWMVGSYSVQKVPLS